MNIKTATKQTEVGVIPEDWEVKQLKNFNLDISDGNYSSKYPKSSDFVQIGIPFIRANNIKSMKITDDDMRFISPNQHNELLKGHLKENDILITTRGDIGQIAIVSKNHIDSNINAQLVRIHTDERELNYLFFAYSMLTKESQEQFDILETGSALKQLPVNRLIQLLIPIPPLPEQTAIATALSDTDALIESLEKLIAKKRLIKQGAMQALLTGKKRLDEFSGEWEVKTFGELFDYLPTATNSRADLSESGDVYYVHYGDIHTRFHNHLNFKKTQPFKIERCKCKNAAFLQNGDWIMANASEDFDGVGKSIEILGLDENTKAVAGLHTFLLREKCPAFAPMFKGHLGNLKALHEQFLRVATGMKVFGVSKTALKDLVLTIPPIEEQTAIAQILSDMDSEIAALETKLDKTRQLKQGMMQELLTGRIRLINTIEPLE